MSPLIEIRVNGEARRIAAGSTVTALLTSLQLAGRRLAVELNNDILPRSRYSESILNEGDQLEIIHAIGGG